MLVIKDIDHSKVEGKWCEREVWGETVGVKIRPRDQKLVEAITRKFKHIKNEQERGKLTLDEMIDHIIEDFRGIGSAPGVPLEVNRKNKELVWALSLPFGEQPMASWILDRANEQAVEVMGEEVKNSGHSPE